MVLFKKALQQELEETMLKEGTKVLNDTEKIYLKVCDYIETLSEPEQAMFIELFCTKIIAGLDDKYHKEVVKYICKTNFKKLRKELIKFEDTLPTETK